jgi:hypothetical protein
MYLFLLAFGGLLSLAGVILAGSGLSDHTFDAGLVTPGIVAVVGGLLLIGLGFALRVLQRIEHALETRPVMPRPAIRAGATPESAAAAAAPEPQSGTSGDTSRIPFPVRITRPPQTAPAPEPAPVAEKNADELPQKFPKVARLGPAPAPEEAETPAKFPLPTAADDGEETAAESVGSLFSRRLKARNGAAPAAKISPRLDPSARAPLTQQRPIGPAFDALWPKGPRRAAAQSQHAPEPETSGAESERTAREAGHEREPVFPVRIARERPADDEQAIAPSPAVAPDMAPEEAPEPVTVLKSGIVDGMAYTLYSDGSIEAQLPQGLLRFGSISELRAHIEQDS